jgi:trimeric autotransporter adhesin
MRRCNQSSAYGAIMALALAMAGCGGSDLSSSSSTATTNASATGIWTGTDSATGLTLQAFINSAGLADFIRADGAQYIGTVQVSGNTLSLSVDGYTNVGTTFSSGSSSYGIGTVDGTVTTGTSISATLTFTPNGGTQATSTWSLTYEALSTTASSLSTIAGTYTSGTAFVGGEDPLSGATVTISSVGVISGQDSTSGCVVNGTVTVGDATTDIYEVAYTLSGCTGTYVALNGLQFTGLAVFNTNATPNQFVIGVTAQAASGGPYYGLVTALTAT